MQSADVAGKRLALLREVVPNLRRLAIMANVDYPAPALEMDQVQTAARTRCFGRWPGCSLRVLDKPIGGTACESDLR
jgi:hypothetical protein